MLFNRAEDFYLHKNSEGKLALDHNHSYYYQVQTQLGASNNKSCFFVVWTNCDIHVEMIVFDELFWTDMALTYMKLECCQSY